MRSNGGVIKQNYLNNRDLLKEIHISKNSYCSFLNSTKDHQYDTILLSVDDINPESIEQAKINRAARLLKEEGSRIEADDIPNTDLVFRVMTWQHIPLLPPKVPKNIRQPILQTDVLSKFFDEVKSEDESDDVEEAEMVEILVQESLTTVKADHIRLNFPPFFHYRIKKNGQSYIVGKSHWRGSFDGGEFCKTHGGLTDNLARMLMKLTEKYALKGNWRNYSYREEMQGQAVLQLCQVALQFDESRSQNPFAFLTQISYNSFLRILNMEKKNQKLRDDLLIQNSMNPSYTRSNKDSSHDDYD
jgi:hypothetical protein